MYAVNFTELLSNGTVESDPSWPLQSCKNGWEYNFTDIPYSTVATELDWVCDDDFLPSLAQAIFFIGAICGGLLFGYVADRYGRIPALAGCNLMGFVAGNSSGNNLIFFWTFHSLQFIGVATAFTGNFWQFSLCRFLVGFAFDNCFTMMYILGKWKNVVIGHRRYNVATCVTSHVRLVRFESRQKN